MSNPKAEQVLKLLGEYKQLLNTLVSFKSEEDAAEVLKKMEDIVNKIEELSDKGNRDVNSNIT